MTIVALKLSPAIVVCAGTTIGNDVSSYTPDLTKMIAGDVAEGVPIFETAYLIVKNGVSIEPPNPLLAVPFFAT